MSSQLRIFFDHSRHKLQVRNVEAPLAFHGEERLRQPFTYGESCPQHDLAAEQLLGRDARFSLHAPPQKLPLLGLSPPTIKPLRMLHGMITVFKRLSGSLGEALYEITLEPRLVLLGRGKQFRLYQHKPSITNVVVAMLCGLAATVLAQNTQASTLAGINHTHWAINHFSVDGRSGIDIIGPYQGGGGGCCYIAPALWQSGMAVRVDWETGSAYSDGFPGFADEAKYDAWLDKVDAQTRQHSKVVPVPDYTGQKVCGLTVHFLPCDELQVSTSCYAYGSPEYPIKSALRLPEPQSCPK